MLSDSASGSAGLNPEGFMTEASAWDPKMAEKLARMNEVWPLTEDHWKVINFVRDYYLKTGQGPVIYRIYRATGLSMQRICKLFPCGMVKGAYRIAGLPKPAGCA